MGKTTSDNNASYETKKADREKALKVLEKAKQITRKTVFLPRGISGANLLLSLRQV